MPVKYRLHSSSSYVTIETTASNPMSWKKGDTVKGWPNAKMILLIYRFIKLLLVHDVCLSLGLGSTGGPVNIFICCMTFYHICIVSGHLVNTNPIMHCKYGKRLFCSWDSLTFFKITADKAWMTWLKLFLLYLLNYNTQQKLKVCLRKTSSSVKWIF